MSKYTVYGDGYFHIDQLGAGVPISHSELVRLMDQMPIHDVPITHVWRLIRGKWIDESAASGGRGAR